MLAYYIQGGQLMREQHVLITLFGATGDLAHRKLYPALFRLFQKGFIKIILLLLGQHVESGLITILEMS